jgi:galactokinase/mevalonate kinase-like predicted kinase
MLQFCPDDQIEVQPVAMEPTVARRLNQNLMLLYTNMPRKAESVLAEQRDNIEDRRAVLRQMRTDGEHRASCAGSRCAG